MQSSVLLKVTQQKVTKFMWLFWGLRTAFFLMEHTVRAKTVVPPNNIFRHMNEAFIRFYYEILVVP